MNKLYPSIGALAAGFALAGGTAINVDASSHREAPRIAEDPNVDNTDVYAFISPNSPDRLVLIANYAPLLDPMSGPNFHRFSDTAFYEVHVDNDGDAKDDITFRWTFKNKFKNGSTFLYNTGPVTSLIDLDLNVTQSYRLERIDHKTGKKTRVADNVPVAPWNVGIRSFPNYESVALEAVRTAGGVTMFAGPRDEGFFVDLRIFDLLGVGNGNKSTDGKNVLSLVLEVPITDLAKDGYRPAAGVNSTSSVVGIYASASRPQVRVLRRTRDSDDFGKMIQVSRLAWPLINETVIPLNDKDRFNRSHPSNDVANFGAYILDPEPPKLLNAVLNAGCTKVAPRTDIVGFLSPNNTTPADLLRIKINQGETFAQSEFPNGRKLGDDVTNTILSVACGKTISDGVDANDKAFTTTFPYLASPASGNPDGPPL